MLHSTRCSSNAKLTRKTTQARMPTKPLQGSRLLWGAWRSNSGARLRKCGKDSALTKAKGSKNPPKEAQARRHARKGGSGKKGQGAAKADKKPREAPKKAKETVESDESDSSDEEDEVEAASMKGETGTQAMTQSIARSSDEDSDSKTTSELQAPTCTAFRGCSDNKACAVVHLPAASALCTRCFETPHSATCQSSAHVLACPYQVRAGKALLLRRRSAVQWKAQTPETLAVAATTHLECRNSRAHSRPAGQDSCKFKRCVAASHRTHSSMLYFCSLYRRDGPRPETSWRRQPPDPSAFPS